MSEKIDAEVYKEMQNTVDHFVTLVITFIDNSKIRFPPPVIAAANELVSTINETSVWYDLIKSYINLVNVGKENNVDLERMATINAKYE